MLFVAALCATNNCDVVGANDCLPPYSLSSRGADQQPQSLHCRRLARNSERLLRVVLRRSGWRWASYFNDSERARIEPYYVQNC